MIRIIDGKPVEVPDDERITPELKAIRAGINDFLRQISADTPENRALDKQYREGIISREPGFQWYMDPEK